jgi:hypothetical protein
MPFALLHLTRQVYQSINPSLLIQPSANADTQEDILQLAASLQPAFIEQYLDADNATEQLAVVHATQSCAVHLADKLQQYMDQLSQLPLPEEARETCKGFYRQLLAQLLHLLYFIQEYHGDQCNQHQRMPAACLIHLKQSFKQWAIALQQRCAEEQQGLAVILCNLLHKDARAGISYGRYDYWKQLCDELQQSPAGDWPLALVRYNFNDTRFINYIMDSWERELGELHPHDAAAQWSQHLRMVNRIADTASLALNADHPSCKTLLSTAIEAEITALQRNPINHNNHSNSQPGDAAKPFQTNLTVTQLAGMVRLLVDTGIVNCESPSGLLRNVTTCFATRNRQSFSPDSLRQKYYHQDTASISILKTHLSNMMSQLRNF